MGAGTLLTSLLAMARESLPLRLDLAEAKSFPDETVIHVYLPISTAG